MDDSIKKEKSEINQNDVKNLLEYKPSSKPKIQVADDRGDGEYFGNIIIRLLIIINVRFLHLLRSNIVVIIHLYVHI